ncbi:MAG TPA: DUF5985 family protein [Verrucomicrobiae bacterium]|jgi:hypothetical protein|nr:DUF5985 family protein [Verrucomicrobiae bacterium]
MIEKIVYLICAVITTWCAILLLKGYVRNRGKLVFWGAVFFVFFALSNIVLFFDLVVLPSIDLSTYRDGLTLAGLIAMIYGLIKEGGRP